MFCFYPVLTLNNAIFQCLLWLLCEWLLTGYGQGYVVVHITWIFKVIQAKVRDKSIYNQDMVRAKKVSESRLSNKV